MTDKIVRFEDVNKSYDGRTLVVTDLDLAVERGEFLTLLGPSGSGKTTCLMMLAGFEAPTSGRILLGGELVNQVPPYKRGIGVVFQNYALFPHMTVAENVAFPLKVRKRPARKVRSDVERALEIVKLTGLEERRPAQLSGGQQQRVALARALVFQPKLVLLDEPLGALDKQLREQLQYELKAIHQELGVTMIYVTHDQSEALTMSDRIAVLSDGVMQQLATPKDLYENPRNDFVAQFVGENNRFLGEVAAIDGNLCTVRLGGGEVLRARLVGEATRGAQVAVAVRPEMLHINPGGQMDNCFQATVADLTYLGDHTRIRLGVLGRDDVVAKIPHHHGLEISARGERANVAWSSEYCWAFPTRI